MGKKYGKQPSKPNNISVGEEKFVTYILQGMSQYAAYKKAFPSCKKWKDQSIRSNAFKLRHSPKIEARIEQRQYEIAQQENQEVIWSREKATAELMSVINRANRDLDRIDTAFNEQLKYLELLIEDEENAQNKIKLMNQYFNLKKQRRVSISQTSSIIQASAELNKMNGFNMLNHNVDGNQVVVFQGEDDLLD